MSTDERDFRILLLVVLTSGVQIFIYISRMSSSLISLMSVLIRRQGPRVSLYGYPGPNVL